MMDGDDRIGEVRLGMSLFGCPQVQSEEAHEDFLAVMWERAFQAITGCPETSEAALRRCVFEIHDVVGSLAPTHDPESCVVYAVAQMMFALAHVEAGARALAEAEIERALKVADRCPSSDMPAMRPKLEAASRAIRATGFEVGGYVTSGARLQSWIGRVVGVNGGTYRVRITYSVVLAYVLGSEVSLLEGEIAPLTSVSIDAAMKGWR